STTSARASWADEHGEPGAGGPQLVGTENALFGAGTTTGGEFIPRTVDLGTVGSGDHRGNGVYERLYPEFGWVGGRVWLFDDVRTRVSSLAAGPSWTDVQVESDVPASIGFRTIAFPGWRAYVDGKMVQASVAPRDSDLSVSPGLLPV